MPNNTNKFTGNVAINSELIAIIYMDRIQLNKK